MNTGLVAVGHLLPGKTDRKATFKDFNHILSACLTEKLVIKNAPDQIFEEYFRNSVATL
jgi:hypothetical protein